ncbi:MAG: glycosyltransferase family 2 protein [Halobacteriota archaeon]
MKPKVIIIILNWNGWQHSIECLRSLFNIDYDNYSVILVDNASTDDSLAKIKAYGTNELKLSSYVADDLLRNKNTTVVHYVKVEAEPRADRSGAVAEQVDNALTVIQNSQNFGFAEGNNIAVAYALNISNPDYILLLNNDTVVEKSFLSQLVNAAEYDRKIGLLQPKILRLGDSTIESTGFMCNTLAYSQPRGLNEKDEGQYDNHKEDGFFYASGACLLIRKSLLTAFSGECFDPHLFAYYEDVDLSWMARLIGFKVVYCPESVCYHTGKASFGDATPLAEYLSHRNRLRVMIKNYSLRTLIFILPLTIVLKSSLLAVDCIVNLDPSYLLSFLKGLGWNVLNLQSALVLRMRIQAKRKLRDEEIMTFMNPYSFRVQTALKHHWNRRKGES